jgi:hypothetical protein
LQKGALNQQPRFRLTKWYLDCVSEEGDAAIIYAAALQWRDLRLQYASLLCRQSGEVKSRATLRSCLPSANSDGEIKVDAPALDIQGTWTALDPPLQQTLLQSPQGDVHWDCRQPKSRARVNVCGHEVEGLGYAECLTMTIPPWRLPMRQLQWGRFISPTDAIIWIDWMGTHTGRDCPELR